MASGCELSWLVELPIVGEKALGHHAEQPAAMDHDATVEESPLETKWGSDE
jgi:hypothetical protein